MQSGRCAFCGARISVRYPFVEALGGALAVVSAAMFGCTPTAVLALIAALVFVALAFIDFETGYLPDALTLPLAALGLVANAFGIFAPLIEGLVGAAAGFLVFWVIGELYRLLRQRDGLGLGDAKLLAAIGAWTGWIYLPPVVLVAAAATLLFVLARGGANADDAAPFGPGLCAAGFVALFFGEQLFTAL
jgi:leader peptidase (prepilin peptidase)/N-methyltransferase